MDVNEVNNIDDLEHYVEGCLNDLALHVSDVAETMRELGLLFIRLDEINKEKIKQALSERNAEIEKLRDEVKEGKFHVKGYSESGHKQFLDYPDLISKFSSHLTNILGDTE
jgi:SMC interacting uncharacterized protein involved in chromosome segregation